VFDHKDPYLALLDWRNTPTEGLNSSPVQRLIGRRTRTLLPTSARLLKPKLPKPAKDVVTKKRETSTLLQQRGQTTKRAQAWRYSKNEARSKRSKEAVEESNMSPGSCAKIV